MIDPNFAEMLMAREELMYDIENVIDELCGSGDEQSIIVKHLCDAVCARFPCVPPR